MSWGIDFRGSSGFVTDPAGTTYCLGDAYPTTRGGLTFGWETITFVNPLDRDNTVDARLAGINYVLNNVTPQTFRVDLPDGAGTRDIRLALGDVPSGQSVQYAELLDNASTIATINDTDGTAAGHFDDANVSDFTAAAWPGGNTARTIATASSILKIRIGANNGTGNATTLAYLLVGDVVVVATETVVVLYPVAATGLVVLTDPTAPALITVAAVVAAASEDASDSSGTERIGGTVAAGTEDVGDSSVAERSSVTSAAGTEDGTSATVAERFSLAVASGTEDATAVTGAERGAGAIGAGSETASAATADERLTITADAGSETSGESTDTEDVTVAVDAGSESFADAVVSSAVPGTITASVDAGSETSADASLALTPPTTTRGHGGQGKTYYADHWKGPTHRITTRVDATSETGTHATLASRRIVISSRIAARSRTSADAVCSMRLPPSVVSSSSETAVDMAAEISTRMTEADRIRMDDDLVMFLYAAYEDELADADMELV